MSRPSRSLPAVNYSGMDEPGGEVVARQQPVQKESDASFFADFGFSSKTATDSLGANMAAIFASPAAPTARCAQRCPSFARRLLAPHAERREALLHWASAAAGERRQV